MSFHGGFSSLIAVPNGKDRDSLDNCNWRMCCSNCILNDQLDSLHEFFVVIVESEHMYSWPNNANGKQFCGIVTGFIRR